ncbi:uncharacterized protein [Linepithema humile]|uniref:uncharacterized protein isoform X4 n=1 Tax=Linepithema humile TaxID=83485 RepID=UPI00351E5498
MPWKIGGNFEAAAVMCETTNWQECVITVANYLWCEMVSDVVEYFAKDGIIWVLAIVIVFTILIRIKYHRNMHVENIVLNKRILNKIEYKIRDLELKVNVLTYKVQYGTWPLPHQIYNLHPKKLQKIRMTLSNPGDRKNWIKHVLLSPAESNMCTLYSNTFTPKAKLPKFFDIKQQHIPHRLQCNKLSTDCSSIEISKSISDQSNVFTETTRSASAKCEYKRK